MISIRSFREKGMLLNNAYFLASEQERRTMNKKPYDRQTAIVFVFITIIFLLIALATLFKAAWLYIMVWTAALCAIGYADVFSVL